MKPVDLIEKEGGSAIAALRLVEDRACDCISGSEKKWIVEDSYAYFANGVDVFNSFRNVLSAEGLPDQTTHMFAQSQTVYLEITRALAKDEDVDRMRSRIKPALKKAAKLNARWVSIIR